MRAPCVLAMLDSRAPSDDAPHDGDHSQATAGALAAGAEDVLPEGRLAEQLEEGRALRVKLGIDPTAPDIHLGHCVVLGKLAQFQQAGHEAVLIIGDYTARVGDPSGRAAERPVLSGEEIEENAATFQEQAFKLLDRDRTEVRFNSEWLEMPTEDLFRLARTVTVAQVLERDDFQKRIKEDRPISALELLYPLLQGYDSVAVDADVELGGTDQKFNLLLARDIQKAYGKEPQSILTMPILPGIDGKQRMSKTLGNYVGITDPPEEMFGKLMSIPDETMGVYHALLLYEELPAGAAPNQAKRAMARRIVERFYGAEAAQTAEERFDQVHIDREVPDDVPEVALEGHEAVRDGVVHLPALIAAEFELSTSEARRLLKQRGVRLDGEALGAEPLDLPVSDLRGKVLQVGKRRFARLG
jgi:tyrosyl-tRNA synthetase